MSYFCKKRDELAGCCCCCGGTEKIELAEAGVGGGEKGLSACGNSGCFFGTCCC